MDALIVMVCTIITSFLLYGVMFNTNFIIQYLTGLLIGFILCKAIFKNNLKAKDEELRILLNDSAKQTFIILVLYLYIFNNNEEMKLNIMKKISQIFEIDFEKLDTPEKMDSYLEKIKNNEIFFKLIEKNGKLNYQIKEDINK